jgi:hypothetical protein
MPRYYLHLKDLDGAVVADDADGADFEGVEQAFLAAFDGARELWGLFLRDRLDPRRHLYEITDATGEVLMTLPFAEILDSCRRAHGHPIRSVESCERRPPLSLPAFRELARRLGDQVALSRSTIARSRALRRRSKQLANEIRLIGKRGNAWA